MRARRGQRRIVGSFKGSPPLEKVFSEYGPKQTRPDRAHEMRSAGAWEITVVAPGLLRRLPTVPTARASEQASKVR